MWIFAMCRGEGGEGDTTDVAINIASEDSLQWAAGNNGEMLSLWERLRCMHPCHT